MDPSMERGTEQGGTEGLGQCAMCSGMLGMGLRGKARLMRVAVAH